MNKWEKFELDCTKYLNETYGNKFKHLGSSDSSTSDIEYSDDDKSFFIEAKMPSAQSGQFVALANMDTKEIVYSPKNKTDLNEYSEFILDYMNKNFEKYFNPGTKGMDIDISQDVYSDWIINAYKKKDVKFVISKYNDKEYVIFPLEQYKNYFQISAKYRVKKSGSRGVAKKRQDEVRDRLCELGVTYNVVNDFNIESKDNLEKYTFSANDYDYMIRNIEGDTYRIRTLSNTYNTTVIFSIKLLKGQDEKDLQIFEAMINNKE